MSTRGRKPKPKHLKVLEGNPGKRAIKDEPRPTPKPPTAPRSLGREAKAEWKRIVPELERLGLLTLVDRAALTAYCEAWERFVTATDDVHDRGLTITFERERFSRNGDLLTTDHVEITNPAVSIAKQAADQLRAFAAEFGLTPYTRSKLTMPELSDEEAENIFTPARGR